MAYERRCLAVADHCVVLDASGHIGFNIAERGVPKRRGYRPGVKDFK